MPRIRTLVSLGLLASLGLFACFPSASPGREQVADQAMAREQPRAADPAREQPRAAAPEAAPEDRAREPEGSRRALALLGALAVRSRGPKLGYARNQFGPAWADTDRNGCDTRNDILRRDLSAPNFKPGTRDCVLLSGTLADPYTRTRIEFERGGPSEVDVDHVVALGNAWVTGAGDWPFKQRVALANDPLNLLAVEAAANRAKGDGDAATWLPSNRDYRCAYVARQIAVKAKYGLWVTPPEREAMVRVLRACPDEPAPVGDAPILAPIDPPEPARVGHGSPGQPVKASPAAPVPGPASKPAARPLDPNYGTCKQAKAHRAGPYVRGRDPEYAYYRDGDNDGVVCE